MCTKLSLNYHQHLGPESFRSEPARVRANFRRNKLALHVFVTFYGIQKRGFGLLMKKNTCLAVQYGFQRPAFAKGYDRAP